MLERLNSSLFDWLSWRNGTILELLNIEQRECSIISNAPRLRKYAVGWCPAEQLPCRPKLNRVAVMFVIGDRHFWTHFTYKEFDAVFAKGPK